MSFVVHLIWLRVPVVCSVVCCVLLCAHAACFALHGERYVADDFTCDVLLVTLTAHMPSFSSYV